MRSVTIRELRETLPEILRRVREGETFAITSRRKVVATLAPPSQKVPRRARPWANLPERLAELERQPMPWVSGAEMISHDRERY